MRQTKPCDHCNATVTRPANRTNAAWAARRYCDRACAVAARRTAGPRPSKTCAGCGEMFESKPYASPAEFAKLQFCSIDCHLTHRRNNVPVKTCEQCGKTFTRRATEGSYRFRGRRTCGRSCGQLLHAAEHRPAPETKKCVVCQAVFTRSKTGSRAKWLQRRYCGVGCANTVRTHPAKPATPRRRKPNPAPPAPVAPPAEERPVWRPAGWAPLPPLRSAS